MLKRIDHIYLSVSNFSQSETFYDLIMRELGQYKGDKAIAVVLQKLTEDRKLLGKEFLYATTPRIWLMKRTRSLTDPLVTL